MAYVHREPGDEPTGRRGRDGFHPTGRQIASAILIALVVVFSLVNLDKIGIDFVVASVEVPLVFVILGSMIIGVAAGALVRHRREHRDHDD